MNRRTYSSSLIILLLGILLMTCEPAPDRYWVYVSSNDASSTAGIDRYLWTPVDGQLIHQGLDSTTHTTSYLAIDSSNHHLYSIDGSGVHSFSIAPETGILSPINSQVHQGKGPCYISISQNQRYLMIAYYGSGEVATFGIEPNGKISSEISRIRHHGSSVHERQSSPHAHMIIPAPAGDLVYVTDLGTDQILSYPISEAGKLDEVPVSTTSAVAGFGPRHLVFHPKLPYLYVLAELTGHVMAFEHDPRLGITHPIDTISILPAEFEDFNKSADIHLSADGRYLYASNRGDNSIAISGINPDGSLTDPTFSSSGGIWPRAFEIDPSDQFVLVANKRSASISVFERDTQTGLMNNPKTVETAVAPQCIKFLKR
ncbi:6-phosphogluconolactonase [Reichenbachiella agariperforans]|uniref:6-phosphogluconolactonase n=1 Tax=Reichenbachiella agariperforans TaxID=156994 RepID=A0A1M6RTG5_REIAG|nr:lactonase family protein [Reichenbachiella agariperforans]SHK35720.1 6-phosphogluconolactonase [Reichenbachiella agariperforans]